MIDQEPAEEFKVERGVPMPERPNGPQSKYPWRKMEIGDSFFVSYSGREPRALQARLSASAIAHRPLKFSVRKIDGGVRVWRVA